MTVITYSEKLLNPLWEEKRFKVLKRDEHSCQSCGIQKNLHVHHIIYIQGREPWQYRNGDLITYCKSCHEWEHEIHGSGLHVERGARAVDYPKIIPRSLAEVIASAIG